MNMRWTWPPSAGERLRQRLRETLAGASFEEVRTRTAGRRAAPIRPSRWRECWRRGCFRWNGTAPGGISRPGAARETR